MNYINGGRGKKAPYMTEMYRIPTPIKETVQLLAMAYRRACDTDSINLSSHLLKQVQSAIAKTMYDHKLEPEREHEHSSRSQIQIEAIRELLSKWKGNSKDTRNWTEANRLLQELDNILSVQDK